MVSCIRRKLTGWFYQRFTSMGRVLVILTFFCGIAGMNTVNSRVYFLFAVSFGFLTVAFFLSKKNLSGLNYNLKLPEYTTAGETLQIQLSLDHSGNRPYCDAAVSLKDVPDRLVFLNPDFKKKYIQRLEKDKFYTVTWDLNCPKRGVYHVGNIIIELSDPFGFMRSMRRVPDIRRLVVYPRFYPLKHVTIPLGRKYHHGGVSFSSKVGDSVEFFSVREFREGDEVSRIHWKSWAKHGKPIVKEFLEEYFVRIALILDTYIPDPLVPFQQSKLEAAVSMAASITNYFAQQDYLIDVFAAGPNFYHITAGRSLAFQEQILEILACVEPGSQPDFPEIKHHLIPAMNNITSAILILLNWDSTRQKFVEELLSFNSYLKVIILSDKESIPDLPSDSGVNATYCCIPFTGEEICLEEL
ncbi:MAG: hypothetical protein A2161_20950 [Candidatus Schekmanbacteria bacterium RBG_13_48_7]|uniref:DUF58 domain-containing protein n=1 Tax=Candidatus Schekmanbacteria bacterium RBG_13_48_7 TaxID=1817878 RepID=A0A1F7RQB9_9BACT|nr:MAG: hypothetical protein A2161_20950 [Candidatus Schekmanbacteria bacterium RBG_13_48_7]